MATGEIVGWVFFGIFVFIILSLVVWWFFLRKKTSYIPSSPYYPDAPDPRNAGVFSTPRYGFEVAAAQNKVWKYQNQDVIDAHIAKNEKIFQGYEEQRLAKMRDEYDPYDVYYPNS